MMKRLAMIGLVVATAGAGCAPPPRPASLAQAQVFRTTPAMREAAGLAPQAVAHADSLAREAQEAYDRGELAASDILAERAMVAYERAAALARIARASATATRASQELAKSQEELAALEAEQRRLEADIDTTDKLIRVMKDAEPLTPTKPGQHPREAARMKAAKSVIVDARLLCAAARLVGPQTQGLQEAEAEVKRLEEALAQWPQPAPIDETLRARTACLSVLTLARRTASTPSGSGRADMLLTELSSVQGVEPYRDDRGIVVEVRGDPNSNDDRARSRMKAVIEAAAKFTEFPVLIVSHTKGKPSRAELDRASQRSEVVRHAFEGGGVPTSRVKVEQAGGDRPVVHDPIPAPRDSRNERVEIVFVSPAV